MDHEDEQPDPTHPSQRTDNGADTALAWVIAVAAIITTVLINHFTQ